jgi:hypothetical protein
MKRRHALALLSGLLARPAFGTEPLGRRFGQVLDQANRSPVTSQ